MQFTYEGIQFDASGIGAQMSWEVRTDGGRLVGTHVIHFEVPYGTRVRDAVTTGYKQLAKELQSSSAWVERYLQSAHQQDD